MMINNPQWKLNKKDKTLRCSCNFVYEEVELTDLEVSTIEQARDKIISLFPEVKDNLLLEAYTKQIGKKLK